MRTFTPNAGLRDRIASIDVVENNGGESLVLPSTSAVLGLQFRGRVHLGDKTLAPAGVTGLQGGARRFRYEPSTASVLVRFTPQGAASLGVNAAELVDQSLALEDLLPRAAVEEARERLLEARDDAARVAAVEALLMPLPFVADGVVGHALRLLERRRAVASVADELGMSERSLERRFVERVGLSPKRFAKLSRFEGALALARGAPKRSLADVAVQAGYFDQSHLVRDWKSLTGLTPTATLAPILSDSSKR